MQGPEVRKLAHGTWVTFAGGVAGNGLNYLAGVLLSRLVGAQIIGIYFLSLAWLNLGSTVARLGLSDALLRFLPPARLRGAGDEAGRILRTTLGLGLVASLALAAIAYGVLGPIAAHFGAGAELAAYLRRFAWTLPLHVLFVLLMINVQAHQRMSQVVLARDIVQPAVLAMVTVGLVALWGPKLGLPGGFAVSLVVAILLGLHWTRTFSPEIVTANAWAPPRTLLVYSLPVMIGDLSHYLYRWLDTFAVGFFLEGTQIGIYSAAIRTSLVISLVVLAANAIYASMASGFFHTGQAEKLEKATELSTRWCYLLAFPIAGMFLVGGDWILRIWGADFAQGYTILAVLSLAQLVAIPMLIQGTMLVMCNRQTLEVLNTVCMLPVMLGMNLLLIPRTGGVGAAVAVLVANVVGTLLRTIQVRRLFGIRALGSTLVKPLLAGATTCAVGLGLRFWLERSTGLCGFVDSGLLQLLAVVAGLGAVILTLFLALYYLLGGEQEDFEIARAIRGRGLEPTDA